jgi:hypothetical protein
VDHGATLLCEELAHECETETKAAKVRREIGPSVIERRRRFALQVARAITLSRYLQVDPSGEKRRIEVSEGDAPLQFGL